MGHAPDHPQDAIERFPQESGAGSWAEVVIVVVRIAAHLAIHGCQNVRLAEEATLVFGGRRPRAAGRNDPTVVRAWGVRLLERTASRGVVLREGSEGAGGAAGPGTSNRAFAAVSTRRRARGRRHSPTSRTALRRAADRAAGVPRRSRDGSLRPLVKVPQHRESPRDPALRGSRSSRGSCRICGLAPFCCVGGALFSALGKRRTLSHQAPVVDDGQDRGVSCVVFWSDSRPCSP